MGLEEGMEDRIAELARASLAVELRFKRLRRKLRVVARFADLDRAASFIAALEGEFLGPIRILIYSRAGGRTTVVAYIPLQEVEEGFPKTTVIWEA